MNFDVIKYALELVIRRTDIDEDVKNSAKRALENQDYLFQQIQDLKKQIALMKDKVRLIGSIADS